MTRWYRAYEGTVTDAKLGEVALVAGCSRSVAIATWHAILESCAAANDAGKFHTTSRRVAVVLVEPVAIIEAVFAELSNLGMIAGNVATAWSDRQFESDSSTERSRKHREHKRNVDATLQQRDETAPKHPHSTEADTESEKKESPASANARPHAFEAECRKRVGQEPVVLAQDFHEIISLLEGEISEDDVFSGIDAAMAERSFRPRHWKQIVGWATRAAKDRLAEGAKKLGDPQARAGPNRVPMSNNPRKLALIESAREDAQARGYQFSDRQA